MMSDKKKMTDILNLKDGDKKVKIIVIVGIVGIIFIFFSDMFFSSSDNSDDQQNEQVDFTAEQVSMSDMEKELEQRVLEIVSSIDGAGTAKVMLTFESGAEYIYESDELQSSEYQYNEEGITTGQNNNYEDSIIIVEGENGSKKALLRTYLQPTVRGVVVVCQGGDDIRVTEQITNAITTAFDLSTSRVWVSKLATE